MNQVLWQAFKSQGCFNIEECQWFILSNSTCLRITLQWNIIPYRTLEIPCFQAYWIKVYLLKKALKNKAIRKFSVFSTEFTFFGRHMAPTSTQE